MTDRQLSVEKLAAEANLSIPTAKSFRTRKPVKRENFVEFCRVLGLNWQDVADQIIAPLEVPIAPSSTPITPNPTSSQPDDAPFQRVREHCKQKILNQHSRMRLLSGEEIGVDRLYVDVWLLNRSPRTFQVSPNKLLENFDLRTDRLGLGDRIKRNPGFEVADAHSKLVILGKPGSGKTTFLKHLAVDWCNNKFQPSFIVVFMELRRIQNGQWQLQQVIDKILNHQWQLLDEIGKELGLGNRQVKRLLKRGKLLVLMDGLDEVPTSELRRTVQAQLQEIVADYPSSRFILTCRTQIITSIPNGFTSVEVAEFTDEQIKQFVHNWFIAGGKSEAEAAQQWKTLEVAAGENSALKELTVTPVLLSLICLVLHDEGEIPSQIEDLYQRGIKLLLSKWNNDKQLEGWEVGSNTYAELSVEHREALLIKIAACKFKDNVNFVLFEQREIAAHITRFLQLADVREAIAVLKAIEAQHGLLIERADELWSFSHLTFQEHLTIRWLTQLPAEQLAQQFADWQQRERIKQLIKTQQCNRLVKLIKLAADQSIAQVSNLQKILSWTLQKSESVQSLYKPAAIRAFYFAAALALVLDISGHDGNNIHGLKNILNLAHTLDLELGHAFNLGHAQSLASELGRNINRTFGDYDELERTSNDDMEEVLLRMNHTYNAIYALSLDLLFLFFSPEDNLEQLKAKLPPSSVDDRPSKKWEQLRQMMIQHHNLNDDWRMTFDQSLQFKRYCDINQFLGELMNVEGAVSAPVRAEIEDSLLLPWSELQRRQA